MKKTNLAQPSVGHALFKLFNHGEVKRLAVKIGNTMRYVYWTEKSHGRALNRKPSDCRNEMKL